MWAFFEGTIIKCKAHCIFGTDILVVSGRVVSRDVVSLTFGLLDTWTFGHLTIDLNRKVQVSIRSNVQKNKCPKDQMSKIPSVQKAKSHEIKSLKNKG